MVLQLLMRPINASHHPPSPGAGSIRLRRKPPMPRVVSAPSPRPRAPTMTYDINQSGLGAGIASLYRQPEPAIAKACIGTDDCNGRRWWVRCDTAVRETRSVQWQICGLSAAQMSAL